MGDNLKKITQRLNLAFTESETRTTESLIQMRGQFYAVGPERWCDTRDASWHKQGGLWLKRPKPAPPL